MAVAGAQPRARVSQQELLAKPETLYMLAVVAVVE